jgi:hypothetical protein
MKNILFIASVALLASCSSMKSIIADNSLCQYDYTISKDEMSLDVTKYILDQEYEDERHKTRVVKYSKGGHTKYVDDKISGIGKTLGYRDNGTIEEAYFMVNTSEIGFSYTFDESGNITEVIDYDKGWNICLGQAIAIAKRVAKYKNVPEECREMFIGRNVSKNYEGRENLRLWKVELFFPALREFRSVHINGETGEILNIFKHYIIP